MGDVAMTAPVLKEVQRRYGNEVRVVMLTPKFMQPFFFDSPEVEFFELDLKGKHKGFSGIVRLFKELRARYCFDAVLDLNTKLFSKLLTLFFRLRGVKTYSIDKGRTGKKALCRTKNKKLTQQKSSVERYADVFNRAGFEVTLSNNMLPRTQRTVPEFAGAKHQKWIGIAPFAKHRGKMLPLRVVRELVEVIATNTPDTRVFIFGGGSQERALAQTLVESFPNCTSAIGRVTLKEEMDLMANLDVMVAMDSSAMHLCSLLGVRVVSIWGATHPLAGFLGYGQSTEDVVSLCMACRPCSVYGNKACRRGDYACLEGITAEMIYNRLLKGTSKN